MHRDEIRALVQRSTDSVLKERGDSPVTLSDATRLLGYEDLRIDSLDLAVIVTELQEETGVDPFEEGFVAFTTVGELVDLFHARMSQPPGRG